MGRVALLICSILSISARVFSASLMGSIFFFLGIASVFPRTPDDLQLSLKLRHQRRAPASMRW
jgi:hypothetical protein